MSDLRLHSGHQNESEDLLNDALANTQGANEDVCCLCLAGRESEDSEEHDDPSSLLRYCDQCKCVLHSDCMQNLIKKSKVAWVMFPTISTLPTVRSNNVRSNNSQDDFDRLDDGKEQREHPDPQYVFVPQPIGQIAQIALHHRFLDLRRSVLSLLAAHFSFATRWLPKLGAEDRFVLAHRFSVENPDSSSSPARPVMLEYIIGSGSDVPPLPEAQRLDTSLLYANNSACSLSIESLPDVRCISCRKPTRILRVENHNASGNRRIGLVTLWKLFVAHAVLVTALSFWCMRSVQKWTGLPDFAIFALPLSSLLHVFWWSVLAGPMWHFFPDLWSTLLEIIVKQRHSSTWSAEQIVSLGQQLTRFGKETDSGTDFALLHTVRLLASADETFLITSLLPSTYCAHAVFFQGLICSRALWQARLWRAESKDEIWSTKLSARVDNDTGSIVVDSEFAMEDKFERAATFRHRWIFYVSGLIAGSNYAGLFGGMSWRTLFIITAISGGGLHCGMSVYAAHIIFEVMRLCLFAYAAWIWIPRTMPNLTVNIDPTQIQQRRVQPVQ